MAQPAAHLTLEEWGALGEDEPGELVDGLPVEEEEVGYLHETVVAFLIAVLGRWLGERGRIATSDARFAVSARRGRKPTSRSISREPRSPPAASSGRLPTSRWRS